MLAVWEEPELLRGRALGQAPSAEQHEMRAACRIDAESPEIVRPTQNRLSPGSDEPLGGARADPGHAEQHLARCAQEGDRKLLRVVERPRGLGIVIERKVARLEHEIVERKAVVAKQMLRLVEAVFACGG